MPLPFTFSLLHTISIHYTPFFFSFLCKLYTTQVFLILIISMGTITATTNPNNKRVRDDSFELESSNLLETKRIRENLLILDEDESDESITQDLDSVMKSFEEEISLPPTDINNFVVGVGDVDEQPDLGFLLEASDDELGLPPSNFSSSSSTTTEGDAETNDNSTVGLDQIWSFDDDRFPSYQDFGIDEGNLQQRNNIINSDLLGDFGDDLFEYSDVLSGLSDFSDFSWKPETLPAV